MEMNGADGDGGPNRLYNRTVQLHFKLLGCPGMFSTYISIAGRRCLIKWIFYDIGKQEGNCSYFNSFILILTDGGYKKLILS